MVENIGNQIHHHINDGHPDHIGLDQGIIPHGNGIHRQLAHTVPHENAFNNGCAAQQAADGQSQQSDNGQQRGFQNAFPQGDAFPDAPGLGPQNIVLTQLLQNCSTNLPQILGGHYRKKLHQQQRHKKIGQAVADKAEKAQKIVHEPVLTHRRPDSQGYGNHHRGSNRQTRKQQRSRKLGDKGIKHIFFGNIAHAHVSRQQTPQPSAILHQKRLIQPQLRPLGINDFLGNGPFVAIQLCNGIASCGPHHGKRQKGNTQQYGEQLQKAFANILFQTERPL